MSCNRTGPFLDAIEHAIAATDATGLCVRLSVRVPSPHGRRRWRDSFANNIRQCDRNRLRRATAAEREAAAADTPPPPPSENGASPRPRRAPKIRTPRSTRRHRDRASQNELTLTAVCVSDRELNIPLSCHAPQHGIGFVGMNTCENLLPSRSARPRAKTSFIGSWRQDRPL